MVNVLRSITILVFTVCILVAAQAQIVINEICSANGDVVYDPQFYNFSGWVELFNAGESPINIGDYYLSDSDVEFKWKIPTGTTLAAKAYLIIWCDKQKHRSAYQF